MHRHSANSRFRPASWGASHSAHQVEGGNTLRHWWDWEQAGRVPESPGAAADHWSRRRISDLAKSLEHNAHVSRSSGAASSRASSNLRPLRHYREVLEALRERGHRADRHALPLHDAALDGRARRVEKPEMRFAHYVRKVVSELGPLARWWLTLNGPWCRCTRAGCSAVAARPQRLGRRRPRAAPHDART